MSYSLQAIFSWLAGTPAAPNLESGIDRGDETVFPDDLHLASVRRAVVHSDSLPEHSKGDGGEDLLFANGKEDGGTHSLQQQHASELSTIAADSINTDDFQACTGCRTAAQTNAEDLRLQRECAPERSLKAAPVQQLRQCRTAAQESVETHSLQQEHASELGTISADSINTDDFQARTGSRIAALQVAGIHKLQWERQPELRLLFQQPDDAVRINVPAAQEFRVNHGVQPSLRDRVLGVTHSRAELSCSLEAGGIKVTMFFVPLKDDMVLFNNASRTLSLEKIPSGGFDSRSLPPKQYELVYPGFWRLSDNKTSVDFLLRPCRYRIFLSTEAKKRLAREELPPPKRGMLSTGAAATGAREAPPAYGQKIITRRELADVGLLNSNGLRENQTLHMVNELTGQMEYSLRFITQYQKKTVDVFKAVWDECSKSRVVAVKRYQIATADPYGVAATIKQWERELKTHKDLDHPCIAKLLAFDSRLLALIIEDRDLYDLASDYWCSRSGPDAYFFRGDIDDACRIAADVSSALYYLAGQGIVHNDIKPANIIYGKVSAAGKATAGALLIDFGLSRVMEHEIVHDGGTPWYIAPEWMEGVRDPPADVYSLGVVMLYLLHSIRLPEKEKVWALRAAWDKEPAAVTVMKAWLSRVQKESGLLPRIVGSEKETKLRHLVARMLRHKSHRIAVDDLVKATREWAD